MKIIPLLRTLHSEKTKHLRSFGHSECNKAKSPSWSSNFKKPQCREKFTSNFYLVFLPSVPTSCTLNVSSYSSWESSRMVILMKALLTPSPNTTAPGGRT